MDPRTFRSLLETERDRIFGYACYFLRDRDDAEDVTQEVFVRLWQRCEAEDRRGMKAWMTRVAHNLCVDVKRRHRTRRLGTQPLDAALAERLPAEPAAGSDPEEDLRLGETQRILLEALEELPEATQSVMLLHYFQGLKMQEIADMLGSSVNTIKVKIHRGRRALRQVLASKMADATGNLSGPAPAQEETG